ncbi:SDR family NAD(P)-dependent oxidoreductase [Spongiibacter marinus]|uniref:SDR family NAD(P)-dependent oxidoreductase n=1 Tax=Spongiibacter marinus TaxID=354246 RepID=UPI001961BF92|nr:SDR family NAD(P)-dependent oxidoreductase [Spongiibacter marinus]MBM7422963.1 NAD(P)-dependent dehydrogenase (short-subunit alcohol dehydrogenase family) [Spongiibacter marinus]
MQIRANQVAVITGAGSGIGAALATACAKRGLRVLVADIEYEAAEATASRLRKAGAKANAYQVDVSDSEEVYAMADHCQKLFGGCDLLCNNAGVSIQKPIEEMSPADWSWLVSVNTLGVAHSLSAFLPIMRQQQQGYIVNTASMAGLTPLCNFGAYTASKYAVVGMSEVLKEELKDSHLGVSVLCPGIVKTQIYQSERNRPDNANIAPPQSKASMETDFDSIKISASSSTFDKADSTRC